MSAPDVRTPAAGPANSDTEAQRNAIIAPSLRDVNPNAWNAGREAREAAEEARLALIRGNAAAIDRLAKNALGKGGKFPGVNRIESHLGRMPFEFPYAGGARVTPRTILGTLIGHESETVVTPDSMRAAFVERHRAAETVGERRINIAMFKLDTSARRLEYTIDEAGIDREFLFDGQFLFNAVELEKLLNPRCRTARADYAARLYLALRRLWFPRPTGRIMDRAIFRIEMWARVNAERLPAWLEPGNEGAAWLL